MSDRLMREVTLLVAERRGLTASQIYANTAAHSIARARFEAFYLLWSQTKTNGGWRYSLPQIAAHFGMDHSSVLYGVRKHLERAGLPYEPRQGDQANILRKQTVQTVERANERDRKRAAERWDAYCKANGWPLEAA